LATALAIVVGIVFLLLVMAIDMAGMWVVFNADIQSIGEALLIGLIFLGINVVLGIAGIFFVWLIDRPKETDTILDE
jgi:hypothetical protein